jgi:hypothetical protein
MLSNLCSIYYFFCLCLNTHRIFMLWTCHGTGLYVLASESVQIPWFDSVFADIGDEQSLSQSLSTFSGHLKQISVRKICCHCAELNAQGTFLPFSVFFPFEILNILFFFPLILSFRILNYNQQGSHWCY